jgi:predicted Zn-dependent protease
MGRIGYNPRGLEVMLEEMAARWNPSGPGFARTHPSPSDRLKDVGASFAGHGPVEAPVPRAQRFEAALAGVL